MGLKKSEIKNIVRNGWQERRAQVRERQLRNTEAVQAWKQRQHLLKEGLEGLYGPREYLTQRHNIDEQLKKKRAEAGATFREPKASNKVDKKKSDDKS
jgi:hypothetical protein